MAHKVSIWHAMLFCFGLDVDFLVLDILFKVKTVISLNLDYEVILIIG